MKVFSECQIPFLSDFVCLSFIRVARMEAIDSYKIELCIFKLYETSFGTSRIIKSW